MIFIFMLCDVFANFDTAATFWSSETAELMKFQMSCYSNMMLVIVLAGLTSLGIAVRAI